MILRTKFFKLLFCYFVGEEMGWEVETSYNEKKQHGYAYIDSDNRNAELLQDSPCIRNQHQRVFFVPHNFCFLSTDSFRYNTVILPTVISTYQIEPKLYPGHGCVKVKLHETISQEHIPA